MISSKLCTVALFMNNTKKAKRYCKTEVEPNSISSRAYHVTDGLWFTADQNTLTFTVVCPRKQKDTNCKPTNR